MINKYLKKTGVMMTILIGISLILVVFQEYILPYFFEFKISETQSFLFTFFILAIISFIYKD